MQVLDSIGEKRLAKPFGRVRLTSSPFVSPLHRHAPGMNTKSGGKKSRLDLARSQCLQGIDPTV